MAPFLSACRLPAEERTVAAEMACNDVPLALDEAWQLLREGLQKHGLETHQQMGRFTIGQGTSRDLSRGSRGPEVEAWVEVTGPETSRVCVRIRQMSPHDRRLAEEILDLVAETAKDAGDLD